MPGQSQSNRPVGSGDRSGILRTGGILSTTDSRDSRASAGGLQVLVNPTAVRSRRGRKLVERLVRDVERLDRWGPVTTVETRSAAEGQRAAAEAAAAGIGVVLAAGGDGTLQSVATGLLVAAGGPADRPVLGIAPLGRGNDLARALGMRPGIDDTLRSFASGVERHLDVGAACVDDRPHVFVNALGIGLDAVIARRARGLRLPGAGAYTLGAVGALLFERGPWHIEGRTDDRPIDRAVTLFTIGNGSSTGGGFRVLPDASPFDGELDSCVYLESKRRRILAMLPRVARARHTEHPAVEIGRFRRLHLRIQPAACVHADGEVLSETASAVSVEVRPAALSMRLPG